VKTSDAGRAFIKEIEGLSLDPYTNADGYWVAGWGHVLQLGEPVRRITEEQAQAYFEEDIRNAELTIDLLVLPRLTQSQYDATVSLIRSITPTRFRSSVFLRFLNHRQWKGAASEIRRHVFAGGRVQESLKIRRKAETELFKRPVVSEPPTPKRPQPEARRAKRR